LVGGHWGQAGQAPAAVHDTDSGLGGTRAQPASITIKIRRNRMWVVYLEMGVALALAVLIVWWTRPRGRDKKDGGRDED
jgi:hypothetical protein